MLKLVRGLNQSVEHFVGCPVADVLAGNFEETVGADHLLDLPRRSFKLSALRSVIKFVKANRIDVIHSHGKGAGLYARAAAAITAVPAVHTFHGLHYLHYGRFGRLAYRLFERSLSALSTRIIAVIESEKNVAVREGFARSDKITVIRTGLENPPDLVSWGKGDLVKAVHFSRFDEQKNFEAMLSLGRAANEAGLEGRLRFVIIGDGPRRVHYEERSRALGLENFFEFVGYVPDTASIVAQCRALISTSRWEGLPVAPLEAGEAGLYLALSRIPGHEELAVNSDGTMLFDAAEHLDHEKVVRWLASLSLRYSGHIAQRKALLEAFSFERMLSEHSLLYQQIVANRGSLSRSHSASEIGLHSTPRR